MATSVSIGKSPPRDEPAYGEMNFQFRDFEGGWSAATLATHLDLYRGYLVQTNELVAAVSAPELRRGASGVTRPRESVSRRMSFELNGVKLHEWYFEQLAGQAGSRAPATSWVATEAMDVGFGGFEGWCADVEVLAKTRGVGWVVAAWDPAARQLVNLWSDLHHRCCRRGSRWCSCWISGSTPIGMTLVRRGGMPIAVSCWRTPTGRS